MAHVVTTVLLAVLATLSLSWPHEALTQSYKSNPANDNWMRQQQDQQRQQQQEQMRRQQQDDMRRQQQQQMRQQIQEQQRQQMQQQQAKQRELIRQQQQKLSNDNKQKIIRDQQQKAVNDNKQSETARQKARLQGTMSPGSNKPTGVVVSNGMARMARPLTAGEIQRGFTGKVTADGRALIKFQNRIFTVPASRVSGLSARLAAEKQRKVRWTPQLQEGVNKKIRAIATVSPPAKHLSGPQGLDCEPKDSPKCREGGGGNDPPRDSPNISGCFPPESLKCQFNEVATRPGPVQIASSPAVQARIDSARLARIQNQKVNAIHVGTSGSNIKGTSASESLAASKIKWVDENAGMSQRAQGYNDAAPGARSNPATQSGQAPALERTMQDGSKRLVKFDGIDGDTMVDRKISVVTTEKAKDQALRQSEALRQNELMGRWEVPTQAQAYRAQKMFDELGIDNITVRVVNESKH